MAVCLALQAHHLPNSLVLHQIASVSVGMIQKEVLLDLDFLEDSQADIDLNIVMDDQERLVEIQGTGEKRSFSQNELSEMLQYGKKGIFELMEAQTNTLKQFAWD